MGRILVPPWSGHAGHCHVVKRSCLVLLDCVTDGLPSADSSTEKRVSSRWKKDNRKRRERRRRKNQVVQLNHPPLAYSLSLHYPPAQPQSSTEKENENMRSDRTFFFSLPTSIPPVRPVRINTHGKMSPVQSYVVCRARKQFDPRRFQSLSNPSRPIIDFINRVKRNSKSNPI